MNAPGPMMAADATALMQQVGARARALREARGLSRRVLSDLSGVSPRYLAQLEAGAGNISIALLNRVAQALDAPITAFLEAPEGGAEVARVATLFAAADTGTQAQVLHLLSPQGQTDRAERLCLIGLRGAGKSTLGAALGARLGLPFIELNRQIEARAGMAIPEIMALYDVDGYRRLEADALEDITRCETRVILAVAGGIVGNAETYAALRARFHTVWLRATPEDHMARVRAQGDTRPMAGNPEAMAQLRAILRQRAPLYARADAVLDTSGKDVATTCDALAGLVAARRFLKPTRGRP